MQSYQHAVPKEVLGEALSKPLRDYWDVWDSHPTAHTTEATAL